MQAVLLLSTLSAITILEIASGEVNLVPMTLSDSSREISIFGDTSSLRTADAFPVVASLPPKNRGGR